ncbi:MAG: anhydro-N-acetylmuramic acid kinase [Alphaproteobacteria bacterium]|nr:anhydro-N-acetylmuramic acid kinase [Alphaproteobacteria bacterium]
MKPKKLYKAAGLMSGTSIDGIDAALIETDGENYVRPLGFFGKPYADDFRAKLRKCLGNSHGTDDEFVRDFERELTEKHAEILLELLRKTGEKADIVGFHGQTIYHHPEQRRTIQIGDGLLLAKLVGIDVVNDFRTADVLAGGNGAPLVPLYHRALVVNLPKPILILNIGGVSNVTWVGGEGNDDILAFDIGPGNALIDDWILRHTGRPFDYNGELAALGHVDAAHVEKALSLDFFRRTPPKSLDRDDFAKQSPEHLNAADGAATLTMMTAMAVQRSLSFLPVKSKAVYVAGGGRHNLTLMKWIEFVSGLKTLSVDELGWSGDGLEAEAFAWLAVRSLCGLPLSLPKTTGVPKAMPGGKLNNSKIDGQTFAGDGERNPL